jgi:hypothetical protein
MTATFPSFDDFAAAKAGDVLKSRDSFFRIGSLGAVTVHAGTRYLRVDGERRDRVGGGEWSPGYMVLTAPEKV